MATLARRTAVKRFHTINRCADIGGRYGKAKRAYARFPSTVIYGPEYFLV